VEERRKRQYNIIKGEIVAKKYSTAYVAENIYHLRKKRLIMSQEKFSEVSDLSVDTISNIE
jgi:hypothetical protein